MPLAGRLPFVLPDLAWADNALEPFISARTIRLHHGKHHRGYVEAANRLAVQAGLAQHPADDIWRQAAADPALSVLANAAGQAWNHALFWNSLSPEPEPPAPALARRIARDFGGLRELQAAFILAASAQFGSGWVWLVERGGTLAVERTANADAPELRGIRCLLTIDVWEHAYYLDYENRRGDFVEAVFTRLLNWRFAESRLDA
jgi:Fe-Mn family superoxide dismutase